MKIIRKEPFDKNKIPLKVCRVESKAWHDLGFYKHHYMSHELSKSAKCFLFTWDDRPVGFVALLNQPHKGGNKYDHRISRIVVDPQYQGLGFSSRMLCFIGGLVKSLDENANLYIKTVHTKMGKYLENSSKWEATCFNGKERKAKDSKYNNRLTRKSYCYKYVGESNTGYEQMLSTPISELRSLSKKDKDNEPNS